MSKNCKIVSIQVKAKLGGILNICEKECFKLCQQYETRVILSHNNKRYVYDYDMILNKKEV